MFSQYAVNYPGVAHLKVSVIVQAEKKSDRTPQRPLRKLEQLKIIKKKAVTPKKKIRDERIFIFSY